MATQLPIDASVKVPAAVLAASQRASELIEAQNAPPEGATAEAPSEGENQEQAQPDQQPSAAADGGQQSTPPAPEPVDENDASWKQKFDSVNGRYARSQQDLRRASGQIDQLQRQIDELMARMDEMSRSEQPKQFERLVTEEEEKDYGSDLLKVVAKKAREELAPELTARDREIEELKKKLDLVTNRTETNTKQSMFKALDDAVPNWRAINTDQNFLDWLDQVDIYSGQQRKSMLLKAYNAFDAARVAAFFTGFLSEAAAVAPQSAQPDPAPKPNKIPLEQLAAPGRPKAAAPQTGPADKPIITRQTIEKFYGDVTKGRYRGREAEYRRIEAEIFEAERDGRVQ